MLLMLLLVLNYMIVSARLRLSQQLFPSRTPAVSGAFITGAVVAAGLALYPLITQRLGTPQRQYTLSSLPFNTLIAGFVYSMLISLCIVFLFRGTTLPRRRFFLLYFTIFVCTAAVYFLVGRQGISMSILYFLVAASIEEAAKYTTSQALASTESKTGLSSDSIILALIVALGFAFLENAVYLRSSINTYATNRKTLGSGLGLLLSRGAISFAIHGVFTGTIALLILQTTSRFSRKKYLGIAGAFLVGVLLHSGRNILLFFHIQRAIILSIVGVYMLLSYLLYQSESIYLKERLA